MRLHSDFETSSDVDLFEVGLDVYIHHPSTKILMMSWAFDGAKTQLWEPHRSAFPVDVREMGSDPDVTFCSWHATFERSVFKTLLGITIPYERWIDPMIWARHLSMPGYLSSVGSILKLTPDQAKLEEGERLVKLFCEPQNEVMISPLFGTSTAFYRDWETDPKDWALFGEYCRRDTDTERTVLNKLAAFPLPEVEQRGWILDQKINDRGMPVDLDLVHGALGIARKEQDALNLRLKELTGLENPNSRDQMLRFVRAEGYPYHSLGKDEVAMALVNYKNEITTLGHAALKLRQQASKTSYKKYEAILLNVGADGRLRYQFSFLGASRAGRWTGHAVQLQNLPRPTKEAEKNMDRAVELLRSGDGATVAKEFISPMGVVTSCIRAAFRAPEGSKLAVCDLNAIENRGLGWVARSRSILEVFEQGRCPYLSFAAIMYKTDYESLAAAYERGELSAKEKRQIAKPAVLGCGYGLGGGEEYLDKNGDTIKGGLWGYAEGMGIAMTKPQAHKSVKVWREANPEVLQLWDDLETGAMRAIRSGRPVTVGPVVFQYFGGKLLRILLPSGRGLHYIKPTIETRTFPGRGGREDYSKDSIYYDGIDQTTRQWVRVPTYGGKLTENIVQAIARDLLLYAMFLADAKGFEIVGHCHDEIIALVKLLSNLGLQDLVECMETRPPWAPDLPLGAAGYEGIYYHK